MLPEECLAEHAAVQIRSPAPEGRLHADLRCTEIQFGANNLFAVFLGAGDDAPVRPYYHGIPVKIKVPLPADDIGYQQVAATFLGSGLKVDISRKSPPRPSHREQHNAASIQG